MTRRLLIGASAAVLVAAFVLVESPARAWDGDDVIARRPRQSDGWSGYGGGSDGATRPRPRDDWGSSSSRYPDRDRYPSRDRYPDRDRYGSSDRYDRYPDRRRGDDCRYGGRGCASDHGTIYRPPRDRDDDYGGRPSRESSSTYGGSESPSPRPRPRPRPSDDWGGSSGRQSGGEWGAGGTGYGGNGGR